MRKAYDIHTAHGICSYTQICEDENGFVLAPYKVLKDGGMDIDVEHLLYYAKEDPSTPLDRIISYKECD